MATQGGSVSEDWSRAEVELVVSDYFDMLIHELRGESYNKADHRRALRERLNARSDGSVEWKHQNISAVLIQLGYPPISGYKRRMNYQRLLAEVVAERIGSATGLLEAVRQSAEAAEPRPTIVDYLVRLEEPPTPTAKRECTRSAREVDEILSRVRPPVDYLEREARNASRGRAGEEFVVSFERERLARLGADSLAERVEHVAVTRGDGLGFDVRSFDHDGSDRFIEVKTTAYGKQVPFFVSKNELIFSQQQAKAFHLYRVFDCAANTRLYTLSGPLDSSCVLEPVQYSARVG